MDGHRIHAAATAAAREVFYQEGGCPAPAYVRYYARQASEAFWNGSDEAADFEDAFAAHLRQLSAALERRRSKEAARRDRA